MYILYTVLSLVSYFYTQLLFLGISLKIWAVLNTADNGNLSEIGQQKALCEMSEFWA